MYLLLSILAALAFTIGGVCMKLSEGLKHLAPALLVFLFFSLGAGLQLMMFQLEQMKQQVAMACNLRSSFELVDFDLRL